MLKRTLFSIVITIFFLGIIVGYLLSTCCLPPIVPSSPESQIASQSSSYNESGKEKAVVKRVIDGDTVELADGRKLRYIGIDAPETVDPNRLAGCYGKEASDKNKELVLGREVELEKDVSETDKFGRLLRYVYVSQDEMVNERLVKDGFAFASTYQPDIKYQDKLRADEADARINKRGLWGSCPVKNEHILPSSLKGEPVSVPVLGTSDTASQKASGCNIKGNISITGEKIYHLPGCGSYKKTVVNETSGERWFCSEDEAQKMGWKRAGNC